MAKNKACTPSSDASALSGQVFPDPERAGEIHFKTDSVTLFEFSLNAFADYGLQMTNISLDLHRDGLNEEHVMTEYETKFVGQGMQIHRCEAIVGKEALASYYQNRLEKYGK